jgi:VanZ family protein
MTASRRRIWIAIAGAAAVVMIAVASLVPADMQLGTGLNWLVEHFLAYLGAAFVFCVAWPRPLIVAAVLAAVSALLELLQGLTPDRVPDLPTALSGAGGALTGALVAKLMLHVRRDPTRHE